MIKLASTHFTAHTHKRMCDRHKQFETPALTITTSVTIPNHSSYLVNSHSLATRSMHILRY